MTLDQQTISELKEKLLLEKKRIEEELNIIANPSDAPGEYNTKFDNIGEDEDENATETEEYADNLSVETNLENQLKNIKIALEKIESGEYGKCEVCGEDISKERLMAYPSAKKCINH